MAHKITPNILIVDGSESALVSLQYIFRKENFSLITTTNIQEAKKIIAQSKPDIVVLDSLDKTQAVNFVKHLKSNEATKNVAVIMLSECTDQHFKSEAINSGTAFFIAKPFYNTELAAKVHFELYKKHGLNYSKK